MQWEVTYPTHTGQLSVKDGNDLPNKVRSHFMQIIFMCIVINQLNAQNLVL